MLYLILIIVFAGLVFLPQIWVRNAIAANGRHRPDLPGTGSELARHLLDEAGLDNVGVEEVAAGDHYDPQKKMIRLSRQQFHGRSISAAAIAAHEFGHALQDAEGYPALKWRSVLIGHAAKIEKLGSVILLATPLIGAITRAPSLIALEMLAGLGIMASTIIIHMITLPVELDASFARALPILKAGKYLDDKDLPATEKVLDHVMVTLKHLTGFSRLLARHVSRRGLVDHKRDVTPSSEREKPAFQVGQTSPSATFRRLPDQPDRAAHRALQSELV